MRPDEAWDVDSALAWIDGIEADDAAMRTLDAAYGQGCDLLGLVYVAALLRAAPERLGSAVLAVRFGPFTVSRDARLDIQRLLMECDSLEAAIGPDPRRGELEALAVVEQSLQQVVDEAGGRPQQVRVLREDGSAEERSVRFLEPAIIPTDGEVGVAVPALDGGKGPGRKGDPGLNVVALLVFAHLRAVRGDVTAEHAADVLLHGLHLGRDTGAIDSAEAMRRRVDRIWSDVPGLVRSRVEMLAHICGLQIQLP